jgi:hypothetical protein
VGPRRPRIGVDDEHVGRDLVDRRAQIVRLERRPPGEHRGCPLVAALMALARSHRQLPPLPRQTLLHGSVAKAAQKQVSRRLIDHAGQGEIILAVLRHRHPQHLAAGQDRHRPATFVNHDQPGQVQPQPGRGRPRSQQWTG